MQVSNTRDIKIHIFLSTLLKHYIKYVYIFIYKNKEIYRKISCKNAMNYYQVFLCVFSKKNKFQTPTSRVSVLKAWLVGVSGWVREVKGFHVVRITYSDRKRKSSVPCRQHANRKLRIRSMIEL